jgi:hypothetical protein
MHKICLFAVLLAVVAVSTDAMQALPGYKTQYEVIKAGDLER